MQRSIWIEGEDWESIREWAKKEDRTISRYLVHLHRDFVNFIEHENLRVAQTVVPEVEFIVPGGDFRADSEEHIILDTPEEITGKITGKVYIKEKSEVIEKARQKINEKLGKSEDPYLKPHSKSKQVGKK